MKTSIRTASFAAAALAAFLVPSTAKAEGKGADLVGWIVYDAPAACAVSVQITASVGGLTDGTEKLHLGAKYSWTFNDGGFKPAAGAFGVGARVLYASPAFTAKTGAKADVSIPDAACTDFNTTGGDLSFDGSLGRNPNLFKVGIPANFGLWRAYTGTSKSIDLSKEEIEFYGFTGSWKIGTAGGTTTSSSGSMTSTSSGTTGTSGSSSGGESGGCSTSASSNPSSTAIVVLPVLGLLATMLRRRRRA